MSKKLLVMIAVIMAIICVLSFTACKQEEEPQDVKFTVTFDLNYEGAPEPFLVTVNENAVVPTQTAPVRNGYNFGGWYTDKTCTTEFTFDAVGSTAVIVKDMTLYAKWTAKEIIDPTPILSTIVAFYNGENIFVGEDLDVADIVVTATYTDTSKKTVTDFTVSGFDSETAGVKTVTVTYTENGATRTANVDVTVVEKVVLVSISAVYGGGDILVGGTLDKATIVVIATYSDETTKAITDFSISGFDSETVGAKTVTVSYTEGEITKTDDVVITVKECEHTGGKATCKTLAVCTECGKSYGELDLDNHEGTAEWTITETTHAQSYTCCSLVVVAEGNHEGGTATCKTLAECTVCEESYGELDADNHEGTAEWTITETTHAQSYTCCSLVVIAEGNHEGGTATCTTKAECTVCEESYGELDADNHEGTAEWTITETTHAQSYICCDAVVVAEGNHEYDNACDTDCNECGYVREVGDHAYDNACDTDCNYCGEVREVGSHVYDNACDTTCNECGDVREVEDHVYSNTCDVDCNVCGEIREITHTYTGDCDEICNVCGEVRETETEHTYVEAVCTVCGQVSPDIPSLSSITATYDQGEKIIFVGDSVDTIKEDIVVTAHYTLGKADAVVEDWTAVIDGTKAGDSTVTITYTEGGIVKTTTVAIVLTRKLALISVEEYEEFVKYNSELQITVHAMFYGMDEDYVEDVTSKVVISGYNKTFIEDTQTVTVSYTENGITETDTIEIAVLNENNGIYAIYEGTLDHNASIEDIIVEDTILAEYVLDNGDHGAAIDSADVTVTAVNASTVGENGSVTIQVGEYTYEITGITVVRVFAGYKVSYVGGIVETNADVDLTNVKVVANYSDESTEDVEEGITLGEYDNTTTGIKEIEVLVNEEVVGTIKVEYGAYNTIYYNNVGGWASVYAHSWGVTETPIAPKAGDYVVTGTFNDWKVDGSVVLYNYSTENGGQYYFEGLELAADTEFKICKVTSSNGELSLSGWYNNITGDTTLYTKSDNIKVKSTGIYNIYFKPNQSNSIWMAKGSVEHVPNVKIDTVFDGTTWPGVQMTAVEGQDGWYAIKVDARANRILFNNGLSGTSEKKTADLVIDASKPYYNNGVWESHIHTYSADCDTTCNYEGCEVTRTTSESHSYPNDCTATTCTVCNEVTKVADEHTGGEATCKTLAVCSVCGLSYGELNLDNHEGTVEWTYTETTHTKIYSCCDKVVVEEENHEYANACDVDCNVCGATRTPADHTDFSYNVNAEDETKHDKVCGICNAVVETVVHVYVDGECVCGKEEPETITTVGIQATLKNDRVYFVDTKDNDTVDAISVSDLVISEVLSDASTVLIPESAYENVTITILSGDEDVAGVCTYVVRYEDFTYNLKVTLVRKLKAVSDDNVFEYDGNVAYGSTTINILNVLVTYYGVEGQFDVTDQVVVGDFDPTYVMGEQLVDVTYTENGITAPWQISIMVIDSKGLTVTQKENVDALVLDHEQTSVDVSEILAIYDVKFVYESGKEEVVTTDITITVSAVECGNNGSITITVDGQSVTIEGLTVVRVLKEITVNYTGDVEIDINKEINTDYITVTAIYSNGEEEAITDYELSEYDYTTVGTKTISVLVDGDKVGEFTVKYVSYTTYYFNNVDGWEEVYAHSWGVTETPIAPQAGDYAIVGTFNGWGDSVANGSAVVLCYSKEDGDGNTEYYFEGLALPADAELKIVKVGSNGTVEEWKEVNLDSTLATGGGSSNVKISGAGNYVFYYTPATGKLYVGATNSGAKEPNVKLTTVFDGTTWHGVQMTAVEGQDGWYSIKVDARANRIIFNNGLNDASEKKTEDLTIDAAKPYYNNGVWEDHIHIYSAVCDDTCDYEGCEVTRTAEDHKYDNACDASCNNEGCEYTRVVGDHVYDNESDVDCNECGAVREIEACEHEYDNDCDAECNLCGEVREVEGHKYDNACDTTCNVCNAVREIEHTYDNACDADCNVCGEERTIEHDYTKLQTSETEHWYVCSVCDVEKPESRAEHTGGTATCIAKAECTVCETAYGDFADHVYDNACDTTCNVEGCGNTRDIEHDYTKLQTSETEHWYVCSVCNVEKPESRASHSGGTATCIAKAVCTVCETAYGDLADHTYDANVWESDENEHWHVCTVDGCEVTDTKAAHEYVDGECECGATESTEPEEPSTTTVTRTIADIADDNSWADSTKYSSFELDNNIKVSSTGGSNTGKYYQSGEDYRIYQSENGTLTITAENGSIVSVKITYTVSNTGVLTLNSTNVASDEVVTVNASSITFGVGNTGTKTNGQVRVTAIEVVYTAGSGSEEPEVCEHVYDNDCDEECNNCGATRTPADHVYDNACDADCNECGATRTPADHNYVDGACSVCGKEEPTEPEDPEDPVVPSTPITASKTIADLITSEGWTSSTTKQTFKLDDVVTVKVGGGANSGKAYTDHIRIYSSDSPAGSLTITLAEGYELVSVKVSTVTGTYSYICVGDDTTTDISNVSTAVSGTTVVLNTVTNGSGKQARVTAIEVVYQAEGGSQEPEVCEHVYDNDCQDTTCNECGEVTREAADHVYDNDCSDTTCANCAVTREAKEHVYDNDCTDTTCANCAVTREAVDHVYDDDCQDTTCANCAVTREAKEHVYDNDCTDTTCANCAVTREAKAHEYEDCDDTTCANCAVTREPVEHNYVDGECTACGKAEPEVHEHVYDNNCDTTCNTCGEERTIEHDYTKLQTSETEHWYVCSVCNVEKPDSREEHTGGTATCTAKAVCTVCETAYGDLADHVYDNACDTTCNTCGEERTIEHDYTKLQTSETEHWYVCSVCNVEKPDSREEHTDFKYSENAEDETKHDKVCGICNAVVATSDHEYGEWENENDNEHSRICELCTYVDVADHTCEETARVAATCIEAGKATYECTVCEYTYEEVLPILVHEIPNLGYTPAYEEEIGYHTITCNYCNVDLDYGECTNFSYVVNAGDETKHDKVCGLCNGVVETVAHVYEDGECVCGEEEPETITTVDIQVTLKDGKEAPVLNHNQTTIAVEEITSRYDIVYVYDNGNTEALGAEDVVTVNEVVANTCGDGGEIQIKVGEFTFDIGGLTVVAVLESITANYTGPAEIDVGAELTGLEVVANYSDGSKVTLSADDYEITDFDNTVEDEYLPIVTYQGYEDMFAVTVNDVVIIHYYNYADWTKVYAHYWIKDGASTDWPGVAMTQDGTSKWWYITVDTDYKNILFNNSTNGISDPTYQTDDATIDVNNTWYVLGVWYATKPTSSNLSKNTVLVDISSCTGWGDANAIICVYAWEQNKDGAFYQTRRISNTLYVVNLPINPYGMIATRHNPASATPSWTQDTSLWNRTTGDITNTTNRIIKVKDWNATGETAAITIA